MFSSPRKPFSPTKPAIPPFSYQATTPRPAFTPAFTPTASPWPSSASTHSSHASRSPLLPPSPTKERPIFELYGDRLFSDFRPGGFPLLNTSQPPTPAPSPTYPRPRPDPAAAEFQAMRKRAKARREENLRNMVGPGPHRNPRFGQSSRRTDSREERKQSRLRGEPSLGEKRREEQRRKLREEEERKRREEYAWKVAEQARKFAEQRMLEQQALAAKEPPATYTSHWEWIMSLPADLPEHELLTTRHLAIPVPSPVTSPSDISKADIEAFLMNPTHFEGKTRRERIRAALLIWHPDKSEKWIIKFREDRHPIIRELVGVIARHLTEMMIQ